MFKLTQNLTLPAKESGIDNLQKIDQFRQAGGSEPIKRQIWLKLLLLSEVWGKFCKSSTSNKLQVSKLGFLMLSPETGDLSPGVHQWCLAGVIFI